MQNKNHSKRKTLLFSSYFYFCFVHYSLLSILAIYIMNTAGGTNLLASAILLGVAILPKFFRLLLVQKFQKMSFNNGYAILIITYGLALLILASGTGLMLLTACMLIIEFIYISASIQIKLYISMEANENCFVEYSKLSVLANLGACSGPMISAYMLSSSKFNLMCLILAAIAIPIALGCRLSPPTTFSASKKPSIDRSKISELLNTPEYLSTLIVSFAICIMYSQINSSIPLRVSELLGVGKVGFIYGLNSAIVIFCSVTIARYLDRNASSFREKAIIGMTLYGASFALIALPDSPNYFVFIAVVVFTLAELATLPAITASAVTNVSVENRNLALTVSTIATSTGEGTGLFLGTALAAVTYRGIGVNYIVLTLFALICALILVKTIRRF